MTENSTSRFDRWLDRAKNHKIIVAVLLMLLVVNGISTFFSSLDTIYNFSIRLIQIVSHEPEKHSYVMRLREEVISLSQELGNFLELRQQSEPPLPRPETWDEDINASNRHASQTRNLYNTKFAGRVMAIVVKLKQAGIEVGDLDKLAEYPTNVLGIQELIRRLDLAGRQLGENVEKN